MKKKTALITGATSGIGKAIAERLAKEDIRLILCGRRAPLLAELAEKLSAVTEVFTLVFDVREQASVLEALDSVPESFREIDILVNNAGNAHGLDSLAEGDMEDWNAMMDGNVKGLLYVSKPVIIGMKKRNRGHIINISSVAARQTYANGVVYCASKKAVDVISEGMRIELTEFGIKVTNIQPGAVATDFSRVRYKGDEKKAATVYEGYEALLAEDIADIVSYVLNVPERVSIAEIAVFNKAQAEPRMIHRNLQF